MTQPQPADEATSDAVTVTDVSSASRFEITVAGKPAGFAEYVDGTGDEAGRRTFPHTVIEEEFGGRGLSTALIRTALDAARVQELAVIPACSAFQHFLAKNPGYLDLVPEPERSELDR